MHAEETEIYYTLLIGSGTLFVLITYFLHLIVREHRMIKSGRLARIGEDIDAREKDRERIARELHDDFASSLATLRMEVARLTSRGEKNYDKVQGIKGQVDGMINRMKGMAHELMPRELADRGLPKALDLLVKRVSGSSGIRIELSNKIGAVDKKKSLHIYRIAQEILNNAVRHSAATVISFDMWKRRGKICFKISDNGKGFNVKTAARSGGGSGLYNISARTQLMEGDMYITSAINEGTIYEFEIPDE